VYASCALCILSITASSRVNKQSDAQRHNEEKQYKSIAYSAISSNQQNDKQKRRGFNPKSTSRKHTLTARAVRNANLQPKPEARSSKKTHTNISAARCA
jgi:hypothetical protein